jgi:hypothetical protein
LVRHPPPPTKLWICFSPRFARAETAISIKSLREFN